MTRHPPSVRSIKEDSLLIGAALIESAHVDYAFEELAVPLPLLAVARRAKLFPLPGIVGRHTNLGTQCPSPALLVRMRIIPSDAPPQVGNGPKWPQNQPKSTDPLWW